eukprot:140675_1
MAPETSMPGYVADLVTKIKRDASSTQNCIGHSALDWMRFNAAILLAIGNSLNEDMVHLFQVVDVALWEKAVMNDLCYQWFHPSIVANPDTFMDALIPLSGHKAYAKLISNSECIMKSLILSLRSRSPRVLKSRYDLVILNLLKLDAIPRKYYADLCESLILLLDIDQTYRDITLFTNFGHTFIFESIVDSLQLLFGISPEITCLESKKNIKKFKCTSCRKWLDNPHKTACKHRYCYLCINQTLGDDDEYAQCIANKCQNRTFKFTQKDERFDFKAWNGMNRLQVKMSINDGKDTFVGEWSGLWLYIKTNLDRNKRILPLNLAQYFDYFCDFMIKERIIQTAQERKQLRFNARNKRLEGNEYFKNNQYDQATASYQDCLRLCPNKYPEDRATYFSNLALSYLKSNAYFDAYKASLSGLALNHGHIKLNNVLSKCYSKTNVSQLFTPNIIQDTFDVFNYDLYLNKVHNRVIFDFYNHFKCVYIHALYPCDELQAMSDNEQKMLILKTEQEDPIAKHLAEQMTEYIGRKINFLPMYYAAYCEEYAQFRKQREMAKREVYQVLMYILAHKEEFWIYEEQELEEEEFVMIQDLLEVIDDRFNLETSLYELSTVQQQILVSGYVKREIADRIPAVIKSLIHQYIFQRPKYNYYKFTAGTIERMVRKSDYLTLSKQSMVEDTYSDKYYGVKLTDLDRSVDPDWREIELLDYDSG